MKNNKFKLIFSFLLILSFLIVSVNLIGSSYHIKISNDLLQKIGKQIWQNECGQSLEGLTCWNPIEDCASLGIGHFIWYPKKHYTKFVQTFPKLLNYLEKNKVILPTWLKECGPCPWINRIDFYKNINSPKMKELRALLTRTINLQTKFLLEQTKAELTRLNYKIPARKRGVINQYLKQLLSTAPGIYTVIDYINFKGLGLNPQEQYNNDSWGLYAVFNEMSLKRSKQDIVKEFSNAAFRVLTRRVNNAPKKRDEKRWLDGWKKRIESYIDFSKPDKVKNINKSITVN